MITVWLKALHVSGLVIWCAGLLVLPVVFAYRPSVESRPQLWQLQRFTRYAYRAVISPAAFLAVVTGTALVFVREVFTPWFAVKLMAVGLLTVLHLYHGYVILHLFDDDASYKAWRKWLSIAAGLILIAAILWLVLDKPPFDVPPLPDWVLEPGGLRRRMEPLLQSLPDTIRPIP